MLSVRICVTIHMPREGLRRYELSAYSRWKSPTYAYVPEEEESPGVPSACMTGPGDGVGG